MEPLREQLDQLCDAEPFHIGWQVRDLRNGWTAERYGDVVVPSASTRKVAILMAALQAVNEGRVSLEERVIPDNDLPTTSGCFQWFRPGFAVTFHDLLLMMIIVSDNVATKTVVEMVGLDAVQGVCDSLGMVGTAHRDAVPNSSLPRHHEAGLSNDTTPNDQGLLLKVIAEGASDEQAARRNFGLPQHLCSPAVEIMAKQRLRSRIPSRLPERTKVANKTGTLGSSFNDVGIVFDGPDPSFIFSAFTHGVPAECSDGTPGQAAVDALIGKMSRSIWDALKTK